MVRYADGVVIYRRAIRSIQFHPKCHSVTVIYW